MRWNNASIARPAAMPKQPGRPHGCSLLTGLLAVILSMVVVGCAGAPPATQIVEVPVYRPCVGAVPVRPDYEFGKLSLDATAGDKVLALARDWPRARKYEGEIEAVLAGCL
jgi:hypothetical protein